MNWFRTAHQKLSYKLGFEHGQQDTPFKCPWWVDTTKRLSKAAIDVILSSVNHFLRTPPAFHRSLRQLNGEHSVSTL